MADRGGQPLDFTLGRIAAVALALRLAVPLVAYGVGGIESLVARDTSAYLHLADRPFTRSCVSIISFYTGLHVRFYDAERHYIEVLETDIQHWERGKAVDIRVAWDAEAGEAILWLDSEERDRRRLPRRLAGAFKRLHLGHRPGNWRAQGRIDALRLQLG